MSKGVFETNDLIVFDQGKRIVIRDKNKSYGHIHIENMWSEVYLEDNTLTFDEVRLMFKVFKKYGWLDE